MKKLSILELDWEDGKQYLDADTGTIWTMKRGTLFTNGVAIGSHERMRDIVKMQFIRTKDLILYCAMETTKKI